MQIGCGLQKIYIGQILFKDVGPYELFNQHFLTANEERSSHHKACIMFTFLFSLNFADSK